MKLFPLALLFVLSCLRSYPQTYSGKVVNAENGQPVPYANIGIIGRDVGTATDAEGLFEIELGNAFDKDTLGLSSIGYHTWKNMIGDFKRNAGNPGQVTIMLSPRSYGLAEVVIKPVKTKMYTLGNYCEANSAYGNAFYSEQLGTELGVVIRLPRGKNKAYLHSARFYVGECTFDNFPVRINIYSLSQGRPYENILAVPVYIVIKSAGEYIIDLKPYAIVLKEDFFISLEYFRVPDSKKGKLVFCAFHPSGLKKGNGYYRFASLGNWHPDFSDNLGFSVVAECQR